MTEDQSDAWQAWDWQDQSWDEDWVLFKDRACKINSVVVHLNHTC